MKKIAIVTLVLLFAIILQGCSILSEDVLEQCFLDEDCTSMEIIHNEENMTNLMSYLTNHIGDFELDVTLHYHLEDSLVHYITFEMKYEDEYTLDKHIYYRDLLYEIYLASNEYFDEIYERRNLYTKMIITFSDVEILYGIPREPYSEQLTFNGWDFRVDELEYYCSIVKDLYIEDDDISYTIIYDFYDSTGIDQITQYFGIGSGLSFDINVSSPDIIIEDNTIIDFFKEQFNEYNLNINFK
ncbi:MAG: hypothetical protein KQ78_01192 [Candidatus Izimaplasma bacterium HR2]|nr:MAG: hypothetical protein KQ78_01192 [Candidatus Izimaplasma bacterium HR2]